MGALADLIRGGVSLATALVDDLLIRVPHERWVSQSGTGVPQYAAAVTRKAVYEPIQRRIGLADGREVLASHKLTFLDGAPISTKDRVTLPDGRRPPILQVTAPPTDTPGTAFIWEVLCG